MDMNANNAQFISGRSLRVSDATYVHARFWSSILRRALCLAISVAVVLIFAPVSIAASASIESIVIGELLPAPGPEFNLTYRIEVAATAYVKHINSIGGINGRKVELVTLRNGNNGKFQASTTSLKCL